MFDDPNPQDVRKLLQSVEADITRTSPNRDAIKASVLATFDEATVAPDAQGSEATFVLLEGKSLQSTWSRRAVGWVAAAAAAFAAVMLLLPDDGTQVETAAPTTYEILSMDPTDAAAPLLPGEQSTNLLAGGILFDAPEGLVVIAASEGQLTLALAEDPEGTLGQLMFVEIALADWDGSLRELAAAGQVSLKELGVMVDGSAAVRLDVTITNEALASRSCTVGEPCMSLDGGPPIGPAALWAGSDNRIVEIGRTEDSMVLAIETSQRFQGPLSRLAAEVVSSASLSQR